MKYFLWFLVIAVLIIITSTSTARLIFAGTVKTEVKELYNGSTEEKNEVVTREEIKDLPACVQKWLDNSGVIGKEKIQTVRLKQKGIMKTEPQKAWMPFAAKQYFNVDKPGFIWYANIKAAPFIHIAGRDKYYDGKGNMLIKIMSLIKAAEGVGKEIDQGSLTRYMAETIWFPTAALNDYIKWDAIDETSARAVMTYKGVSSSGVFVFNQQGDVVSFSAQRWYRDQGGSFTLAECYIPVYCYKEYDGLRVPAKGEIIWRLPEGDFNWLQLEVTEIEYNKTVVY